MSNWHWLGNLFCPHTHDETVVIPKPEIPDDAWHTMPCHEVKRWLEEQELHIMNSGEADILKNLDATYWYTTPAWTAAIIYYIYDTTKVPGYRTGRFDCDGFALWLKGQFEIEFGHNANAFTIGRKPGPHAYNTIMTTDGWYNFEPQDKYTREMFPYNTKGYEAEAVLV